MWDPLEAAHPMVIREDSLVAGQDQVVAEDLAKVAQDQDPVADSQIQMEATSKR